MKITDLPNKQTVDCVIIESPIKTARTIDDFLHSLTINSLKKLKKMIEDEIKSRKNFIENPE